MQFLVFQLNWLQLQNITEKCPFVSGQTNLSFLCLGTRKILSLGEFDELKSHLFSVHFSDGFVYKKTDLYAGIWNKLHQIAVQQGIQKKAEIVVKGAECG